MRVLVTYGSKMGGTAGIAEMIGDALVEAGYRAEVQRADEVTDIGPYDAVIVGGVLYATRWHRDARRFVRRHAGALRSKPVWMFSSGPLDDSATEKELPPVGQVRRLMERVEARGHVTFGGRLPTDAKGLAGAMAKKSAGDWRDPEHVRAWTKTFAAELQRSASTMR